MKRISAHYIFDGYKFIKHGILTLDNKNRVVSLKENPLSSESERLAFYNGIIIPGMINMHSHLELSHFKNKLPKGLGMSGFIKSMMHYREINPSPSDVIKAMHIADKYMFANGVSVVADVSNTSVSIKVKKKSQIKYHTFVEIAGINKDQVNAKFDRGIEIRDEFLKEKLSASIAPHALYSVLPKLLSNIIKEDAEPLSIHFLESDEEFDAYFRGTGSLLKEMREINEDYSPPIFSDILSQLLSVLDKRKLIPVHNLSLSKKIAEDFLNNDNVFPCICPESNLYIHNKLPDIDLIMGNNINIVLGTDSLASNTDLSIISELKTISNAYPQIELKTLLTWVTSNAANALNLQDSFGGFELGMCPGVVLLENIDLQNLTLTKDTQSIRII